MAKDKAKKTPVYYLLGLVILSWAFGRPLRCTGDDVPLWNE